MAWRCPGRMGRPQVGWARMAAVGLRPRMAMGIRSPVGLARRLGLVVAGDRAQGYMFVRFDASSARYARPESVLRWPPRELAVQLRMAEVVGVG